MLRPIRALPLLAALAALSACDSGGDGDLRKEVDGLKADVQRVQKDAEKLGAQVSTQTRRIDGLAADLVTVRGTSIEVKAAAPGDASAAATDGAAPADAPAGAAQPLSAAQIATIRSFLSTDEGKKVLEEAVQGEREARERERARRLSDSMVERFAKTAALTEDQTKRMKDVMSKQAESLRTMWANVRELPPDAPTEQRDALRQQNLEKTEQLRKETDDQVKAILSQTQYEQYKQQQTRMRGGLDGAGNRTPGAGAGVRRGARANGGNQQQEQK
jgi:hypothetical protein